MSVDGHRSGGALEIGVVAIVPGGRAAAAGRFPSNWNRGVQVPVPPPVDPGKAQYYTGGRGGVREKAVRAMIAKTAQTNQATFLTRLMAGFSRFDK